MANYLRSHRGKPETVTRVVALETLGGGADRDLAAAAGIIAAAARVLSAGWSHGAHGTAVPESIGVAVRGNTATISASAPPARPAELRLQHPLFGDREHWYGPPGEPFLAPAADQASDAAMRRYAQKIDGWCRKAGYR